MEQDSKAVDPYEGIGGSYILDPRTGLRRPNDAPAEAPAPAGAGDGTGAATAPIEPESDKTLPPRSARKP